MIIDTLLRHVRYVAAVVDQGSFTRAGELLHVSQPALSQQIRQLEDRLGVQLLDRSGRRVRLTDAGKVFLEHGRRALAESEAAARAACDIADLSSGELRIGFTPTFSTYLMAPLAARFHDAHPGIRLQLITMSQSEIEAALADDLIDCGIAFGDIKRDDLEVRHLHAETLCLVGLKTHPIMRNQTIDGALLEGERLALLSDSFATRHLVDAHFRRHKIKVRVAIETSSINTIMELLRTSGLLSILPDHVARGQPDLAARPLLPAIETRRVALLQREGGYRTAAARAFADIMSATSRDLEPR